MQCSICQLDSMDESEQHLHQCSEIIKKIGTEFNLIDANYEDIFSENIEDQVNITKIYKKIMKIKALHLTTD